MNKFSKSTLNPVNHFNKCHFVVLSFVGGFYLNVSHTETVLLMRKCFFWFSKQNYLCSPMSQGILSPRNGSRSSSLVWSQVLLKTFSFPFIPLSSKLNWYKPFLNREHNLIQFYHNIVCSWSVLLISFVLWMVFYLSGPITNSDFLCPHGGK